MLHNTVMPKLAPTSTVTVTLLLAGCQFVPGTHDYDVKEGERAVAMTFADPDSTQFKGGRRIHTTLNDAPNVSICGLVNTKNLMGAYTGFKRYVHNKGRTLVDPQAASGWDASTQSLTACNKAREQDFNSEIKIRSRVACRAAEETNDRYLLQAGFEKIYYNNCRNWMMTPEQLENAEIVATITHNDTLPDT